MDQNNQDPKSPSPEKSIAKLEAVRAAKALQRDGSNWTVVQEVLQEIIASYIVVNPDKIPPVTHLVEDLRKEVEARYVDDAESQKLLLDSIPEPRAIRLWLKKDGWDEAVWGKIRTEKLFSSEKRAQVIESLRVRAMDKSDMAAKLWLTLSGDYSEKMEINDKTIDTFREIQSVLQRKSREEE